MPNGRATTPQTGKNVGLPYRWVPHEGAHYYISRLLQRSHHYRFICVLSVRSPFGSPSPGFSDFHRMKKRMDERYHESSIKRMSTNANRTPALRGCTSMFKAGAR